MPNSSTLNPTPTWGPDIKSGFFVFLIALPLCLGIAMASSFPPVAGIITAIVGGLIGSLIGSARLTIKGPAAGLIVIVLGAVTELGQGDAVLGYRRALAVGVVAAVLQILLALMRSATIGIAMSPSVVHGMLAAIGVIIVSKQVHTMVGVKPTAKEPLELLAEIPHSLLHANPEILAIGVGSLLILFLHPLIKVQAIHKVPAQVFALLFAIPLGFYFDVDHAHAYQLFQQTFHVSPAYLVTLPGSLFSAISFPNFDMVMSATSVKYIVMFTLVGSIESVLSLLAVDALDPQKRASNLNKDLLAVGVGNLIAASIGGLPMISEIVRSKANIDAGAQSARSNFAHGAFLLLAVALIPSVLHQIPLAALAAMLVYTGTRLASPNVLLHAKAIGADQLVLFSITLVITLATDLLIGVGAGLLLELGLHWKRGVSPVAMMRSRVETERDETTFTITMHGAATFASLLKVRRALHLLPESINRVRVDLSNTSLVDHTFLSRLHAMADESLDWSLELAGLETHHPASAHPFASRRRSNQ